MRSTAQIHARTKFQVKYYLDLKPCQRSESPEKEAELGRCILGPAGCYWWSGNGSTRFYRPRAGVILAGTATALCQRQGRLKVQKNHDGNGLDDVYLMILSAQHSGQVPLKAR